MLPAINRRQAIREQLETALPQVGCKVDEQERVIQEFLRWFGHVRNEAILPKNFFDLASAIPAIAKHKGLNPDVIRDRFIICVGLFFEHHKIPMNSTPELYNQSKHFRPPVALKTSDGTKSSGLGSIFDTPQKEPTSRKPSHFAQLMDRGPKQGGVK